MQWPVTVPLGRPLVLASGEISELVFDEPDLGTTLDFEEIEGEGPKADNLRMLTMLSGMAGISIAEIRKIKQSDFDLVVERVLDPYQRSQSAGKAPAAAGSRGI